MTSHPPLSHAEKRARDERFNFVAFLIDSVNYFAVTALLSPFTILPLFASRLTSSTVVVSLIPMLNSLAITLPQIWGARLVAHRVRYRPFLVRWVFVERFGVLLALVLMMVFAHGNRWLLLAGPLLGLTIWWGAMGVNAPAYNGMLDAAIEPERRGRLVGLGQAIGGFVGVAFAGLAMRMLNVMPFPNGFIALTGIAFVTLVLFVIPLCLVRETPRPRPERPAHHEASPLSVLRRDRQYRAFLLSQWAFAAQALPTGIYTTHVISRFNASAADIAFLGGVMAGCGAAASLAGGWVADRRGNRVVIYVATGLCALGALAMYLAPNWPLYVLAFVPASFGASAWGLANFNITIEYGPPGDVPAYTAAMALFVGPWRIAAPLAGGFVSSRSGGGPVFLTACAGCLAALLLVSRLSDPRGRHSDAVRAVQV